MGSDPSLEVLPAEECYRLLGTQQFGRLAVVADHLPLVFPVNFALDGQVLVVRTSPGTKLTAADHANVVFEVDEVDQRTRSGWSVVVRCLAEEVTPEHGRDVVARTRAAGAEPWAPGEHGSYLRLIPQAISGRRIVPGELPPPVDPRGYL